MKHSKLLPRLLSAGLLAACLSGCAAGPAQVDRSPARSPDVDLDIVLNQSDIQVHGDESKDSLRAGVFTSNDIIYYEDRDSYDSGNPYGEGTSADRHTAQDAAGHTVVNITAPGTYRISGQLDKGQIRVDLGEDARTDPEAVVTLVLSDVDITCQVAPAIVFLNVYECDNDWSTDTAGYEVDTSAAGANIILADGSANRINGSYVARIYKDAEGEKKLWKQDGAIYSYMSMNVDGSGTLDLTAANEGLDTELHLTINGGNINIRSQNDGINTNEDGVSVTTINGGNVHIIAGLGEEGDGIDSNGWLVINGGTVVSSANPAADAGLDSDMGSFVNGGTVVALGSTMDWAESDSQQVTMNLQFADYRDSGDAIIVMDETDTVVFAYDPAQDEVLEGNTRRYRGAVVSSPNFAVGDTYQVYIGGTVSGTEAGGVYDVSTINACVPGTQQAYTGTDVGRGGMGGGRPGGMGGQMGQRPPMNEGDMSQMPQRPEGEMTQQPEGEMTQRPEGEMTQRPEGDMTERPQGQRPQMGQGQGWPGMPEGEMPQPPEVDMPQMPEFELPEDGMFTTDEPVSRFYMQDKVNAFSGVADLNT